MQRLTANGLLYPHRSKATLKHQDFAIHRVMYIGLSSRDGNSFWDFEDLFVELLKVSDDLPTREMAEAHRNRLFYIMVGAIQKEQPRLRLAFDKSARLFYVKQIVKRLIKYDYLRRLIHRLQHVAR